MTKMVEFSLTVVVNFIIIFSSFVESQDFSNATAVSLLDIIIPPNYQKTAAPKAKKKAANVISKVQLLSLAVEELSQAIKVTMSVYVEWNDTRLQFPLERFNSTVALSGKDIESLWIPNLYFVNELTAKGTIIPTKVKMDYNTTTLHYHIRYSTKIICDFWYDFYPMDTQTCFIQLQSFEDPVNELYLTWEDPNSQLPTNNTPTQFHVDPNAIIVDEKCEDDMDGERMSCISLKISMRRLNGFHSLQMFIPSILIVVVSWMGFWISVEAVPGRVSLGITSLLTLVTQFSRAQDGLPPISYVKAIDVWMIGCLVMVFASMVEYTVAYVLHSWKKGKKVNQSKAVLVNTVLPSVTAAQDKPNENSRPKPKITTNENENIQPMLSYDRFQKVDKTSRFLFPIVYFIFIVVYWLKYSTTSK